MLPINDEVFIIDVYSHSFHVHNLKYYHFSLLSTFVQKFVVKLVHNAPKQKNGRFRKKEMLEERIYAHHNPLDNSYRFHINQLKKFMLHLAIYSIAEKKYRINNNPLYTSIYKHSAISLNSEWSEKIKTREYQLDIIKYVTEGYGKLDYENVFKIITIQTGKGKTLTTLAAIGSLNVRSVIMLKSSYAEGWGDDILKYTNLKPKDIALIQGSSQLVTLMNYGLDNILEHKMIIISITTYLNYIKDYHLEIDQFKESKYPIAPIEFFERLQIGALVIDEMHQNFYGVYTILAHTHIPLFIGLSATLLSSNKDLMATYELLFPHHLRYNKLEIDRYIAGYFISYHFNTPGVIKYEDNYSKFYSHHVFETSIIKHKKILMNYLAMIKDIIEATYIHTYESGDKLLIFAASIDMCTIIKDYLSISYQDLDVRRYVDADPYENVIDADIRVSTVGSCGARIDIPQLTVVINTHLLESQQANLQLTGRLRKIEGRDVRVYMPYSLDIPKHVAYNKKRIELLTPYLLLVNNYAYNKRI